VSLLSFPYPQLPLVFDRRGTLLNLRTQQGFRKYLTQARDHEELLSFLLGQIVKEKARFFQLQRHQQPELVSVNTSELDERVCNRVALDTPRTQVVDDDVSLPRPKNTRFTTQCHSCSLACSPRTATRSTVTSSKSVSSSKIRGNRNIVLVRNAVFGVWMFLRCTTFHAVHLSIRIILR
jgi:hypothetical protein